MTRFNLAAEWRAFWREEETRPPAGLSIVHECGCSQRARARRGRDGEVQYAWLPCSEHEKRMRWCEVCGAFYERAARTVRVAGMCEVCKARFDDCLEEDLRTAEAERLLDSSQEGNLYIGDW